MRQRPRTSLLASVTALALLLPIVIAVPTSSAARRAERRAYEPVQTLWTVDFGLRSPSGIAYLPGRGQLLVSGLHRGSPAMLRVSVLGDAEGAVRLDASDPGTMAFDEGAMRLAVIDGDDLVTATAKQLRTESPDVRRIDLSRLGIGDPRAATFDPSSSTWYVLDAARDRVTMARIGAGRVTALGSIPLDAVDGDVRAIAFNPSDDRLYVATADTLVAIGRDGRVLDRSGLGSLRLRDLRAMTFAPSADTTDARGRLDLYLVDAGSTARNGRLIEARMASAPRETTADTVIPTLIQRIETSAWSPGSPDPSGVAWVPSIDRLWVVDSEVDEVTGAGFHGVNMWQITRTGSVTDTGTTHPKWGNNSSHPFGSKELTGAAYDPNGNALLMSDDSANRVWIDKPGPDGRFGTGDDVVTFIRGDTFGITDDEDPEYYSFPGRPQTGHIFFLDGISTEIYDINPVNGVFGDGDDTATHFDIGKFGPTDFEGLAMNPVTGNLYVGQRDKRNNAQAIFEITPTGDLVNIIDVYGLRASAGLSFVSGLTVAPATNGSGQMSIWIVDRAVDNGANSNENDGKLFEISVPGSGGTPLDTPPTATLTAPTGGSTVSGTIQVTATANDDHGVTKVDFFDGTTLIGTDTNGADGWSTSWDTTTATNGAHQLTARATDNATSPQSTTSAAVNVTVDNTVAGPPTVSITSPSAGAVVRGTVTVTANASAGVTQVQFFDGASPIGTDTDGSNGWSISWNTTAATNGAHQLKAVATASNQTGESATVGVTVDNAAPSVSITSPTNRAFLSGTVPVVANAADGAGSGVASVEFFANTGSIGTDSNGADGWSIQWNTAGVPNGEYALTARATDRAGNTTTSSAVTVTTFNIATARVLDVPIRASSDDAEERSPKGNMELVSSDLDMMTDSSTIKQAIGLRFTNVTIPRNATVTNAYVQFQADKAGSAATTLQIQAQATDNPSTFGSAKRDISSRPRTTAAVTWTPVAWPTVGARGPDQRTPNLKAVLEEIFARSGWASGNALVLVITGSGDRTAEAWDETNANAIEPVLHIEYIA